MVSALDRSDVLILTKDDFNRALGWLLEAESTMADIFKAGAGNADARAMDEIYHLVQVAEVKGPVPERKIINIAKEYVPIHSIERVIRIMESSGMICATHMDKRTGQRYWKTVTPELREEQGGLD